MLDKCMERNIDITGSEIEILRARFLSRLKLADELFDGRPFALSTESGSRARPVAGVYDAVMVALDKLWTEAPTLLAQKSKIQAAYHQLVKAEASTGSLTGSANTAKDIRSRLQLVENVFRSQASK
jgi:hypothetical protein